MVTWVTQRYSDAKSRGNVVEMSGNFTVLAEWPACYKWSFIFAISCSWRSR